MTTEKINLHPKKTPLYCRDCGGLLWERVMARAFRRPLDVREPCTLVQVRMVLECEICGDKWDWTESSQTSEDATRRSLTGIAVYNREDLLDYYYKYERRFFT